MNIVSVRDLQVLVRNRRQERGLTQAELAERADVSRKWVYGFENGAPGRVELALVLRVLAALDVTIDARGAEDEALVPGGGSIAVPDLAEHLARVAAEARRDAHPGREDGGSDGDGA
ncbi:helix-turn-helix domain-containing protein [Cellulomonas oligotrophica]|uniref:Transcriptional regulator with XRE-family HTH domain n=1 Tax=Cellulomonas oligotrophica TaxID=931536 RepID=A0A7Y9FG62_9CELL|nr:helix-turn-helix domain-containing protein [Cellulomonas oligotrophica]NYD86578.1 transcriptional regulator with XRE-family HTH domain [Cellulomonas oligotrophica]GIG32532.1 hypothetical protein Col01nite_16910 [Cellulomonas oligotrophica]